MKIIFWGTNKMPINTQEVLLKIHNSRDTKEKRKYVFRLSRLLKKESADELKERLDSSNDTVEIEECRFHLWCKELDRSLENLLDVIHKCNDERKVMEAIRAIGDEKYFDATNMLVSLLSNSNSFFRNTAALSLSKIPTQDILLPVIKAIKDNPDNCESLVYPLQEIDCTEAIELLIDLFIKKEKSPLFRINVILCFKRGAVKRLTLEIKKMCCEKLTKAISNTNIESNLEQLEMLYEWVSKTEVVE